MDTVHFLGKVLPEGIVNVSVGHDPTIHWPMPEFGITANFLVHVKDSRIDVECSTEIYRPELFVSFYIRALDLSRGSVQTVAFAMGCGLNVILERFVDKSGIATQILFKDDALPPLSTALNLGSNSDFDKAHTIVLTDTGVRHALNDLIEALSLPHVGPVNCALAMDRLRHIISPGAKDPQSWRQMRDALRVSESYLKYITEASKTGRHGRPDYIPGDITTEALHRAWIVFNRYLEYRKRNGALPESDFPLLGG